MRLTPRPQKRAIPWSQIGAKAGADYQGDGLAVIPTAEGARLRCVFQRLEGEATREGLWLTSTVTNAVNDRFRVVAAEVGRDGGSGPARGQECGSVAAFQLTSASLIPKRQRHSASSRSRTIAHANRQRVALTASSCASSGRGWWRNTP